MVDVAISLRGANGDTIALAETGNFVLSSGVYGFGIPTTEVRIDASAGDGGVFRNSKRGVREIDLPIVILGSDRAQVQNRLRRLARLLQDRSGPTRLIATFSDGTSLFLETHYVGGAETIYGEDAGRTWARWVVQMQAPQPYWQSANQQSFTITTGQTGRGLLPQLTKLKVSSSESLGLVTVTSAADVDVFPVWTIKGPISDLRIRSGSLGFTFAEPVLEGETITINTERGTVTDQAGANRYAILGPAPKLFPFPPGTTNIEVLGTETSVDTFISCNYALRFEVVH
jgi:phage-related protein